MQSTYLPSLASRETGHREPARGAAALTKYWTRTTRGRPGSGAAVRATAAEEEEEEEQREEDDYDAEVEQVEEEEDM